MATQTAENPVERRGPRRVGRRPDLRWRRLLAVGAVAVAASTIANVLIAQALASLFQVPAAFRPLQPASVASLTVLGVTGAVLVFAALNRLRPDPVRAFTVVAAIALLVSWTPDLAVYASGAYPGTTVAGVLSLMSLHVVAAAIAVFLLGRYGVRPDGGRE
jgi:uncharacterized protein DUF6069